MCNQGRSHEICRGQVSGACVSTQQLGEVGGMPPPRKFLEFRGYEIASETIFGPKRCFSEARRQSSIRMNSYPFCPLRQIAAFHSLISQAIPFADEACETNRSLGRTESCWKTRKRFFRTVCSHLVLCFNVLPRCVCAMGVREHWPYLATPSKPWGRPGKSGPVETGLTGPVATALLQLHSLEVASTIYIPVLS